MVDELGLRASTLETQSCGYRMTVATATATTALATATATMQAATTTKMSITARENEKKK
jgi:hypothetical protein